MNFVYRKYARNILLKQLKEVIHRQYGILSEFVDIFELKNHEDMKSLSSLYFKDTSQEPLKSPPPPVQRGKQFFFPVYSQGRPWGFLILPSDLLTSVKVSRIKDTIELIMALKDSVDEKHSDLENMETRMRQSHGGLDSSSHSSHHNVISLGDFRRARENKRKKTDYKLDFKIDFLNPHSAPHLWIRGTYPEEIHQWAIKYFCNQHKQGYAFLHYKDLSSQSRQDLVALQSLGNVTLYVSELSILSCQEIRTILQILDNPGRPPCLIVGSLLHQDLTSDKNLSSLQRYWIQKLEEKLSKSQLRLGQAQCPPPPPL